MEKMNELFNKLEKQNKKKIRIFCPFINYEKSSIFELFLDEKSELKIKLLCHNHIFTIKSYFNYFSENLLIKKDSLCESNQRLKSKAIAFCICCSSNICQNCLSSNHNDHIFITYSNLIIQKDLISKEFNNISKNISMIIEKFKNNFDNMDKKEKNHLEVLYFICMIGKIAYIEYLQEAENEKFSYACIKNLNYIRETLSELNCNNILNLEENGNLPNLNEFLKEDYLSPNENLFADNNIFQEEIKINLDTYNSKFMAGNEAYFILFANHINIYSFKTYKLLFKIDDNKSPSVIRFSPNDCNLFLSSNRDAVKIYKIKNKNYELLNEINFGKDAYIKDSYFIPNNKDNILILKNNLIKIFNLNEMENVITIDKNDVNSYIDSISFSYDGNILGCFYNNFLIFYSIENKSINELKIMKEEFSFIHIRNKNNNKKYNLILIKDNYIQYYDDILGDKFEKIKLSYEAIDSNYVDDLDYLFLFSHCLTIFQVSNWDRILQIKLKRNLLPLNSSRFDKSSIKGFISIHKLRQKILYKYSLYFPKIKDQNDLEVSRIYNDNNSDIKSIQLQNYDFNYIYNIFDEFEGITKNYLKIPEIKKQMNENFKYSLFKKKSIAKKYLKDFKEKGTLYEQYINLVKIIINDNVEKKILIKYLKFLKLNYEKLIKNENPDNIDSYDDEIKYYSVCFTKQELIDNFEYNKEKDEKTEFLLLLNQISKKNITEQNFDYIFEDLEKIKDKLPTFNQPIEFTNKELYFYMNKASIIFEILKKKEKKQIKTIKNIQNSIKLVLERKLLDNENIINNESKFTRLMIIILRGQEEEIAKYNINLLNENNYSLEEKKELISKIDNSSFLKINIIPGLYVDLSKIQFDKMGDKFNFDNILITLLNNKKFEEYELYNDEQLSNYFKTKIDLQKIKRFMIDILLSNSIKEAFSILYEEKYKYPFINKEEASEYVNNYIDFVVLKDKKARGVTNKYTFKTKIFLKKCKHFYPEDMSKIILYDCLYSGKIVKVFLHELNHEFYNFYFYHSNGSIPLSTPRKQKIKKRGSGKYFEILFFKESIKKINLNQALYILNRNNYDKTLSEFSKDFQFPKENDLKLEGEFSYINEEITKLRKEDDDEDLSEYYLKTDEDNYINLNDSTMDAEIEDDVIGSYL